MIKSYMAIPQPVYSFCWQGGEPTLMGYDFFRKVTDLQRKYGRKGGHVFNALQTNGTRLNDSFAKHLYDTNFLVGVSLDGPSYIHNYYRKYKNGRGTHADVLRGLECLKRNHVEFNILTLVSDISIKKGKAVYSYLRNMGLFYHQYIPCVEFSVDGKPFPVTVSGEAWGDFLCEIYDEWMRYDTCTVSVRLFDSIITYLVNGIHDNCQMGTNCCHYYVIEYNGDIYPCDFFVDSPLKLGNIKNNSWENLVQNETYLNFGRQKSNWHEQCQHCEYLAYCQGDCLKHRFYGAQNPRQLSWLCKGWKQFFKHALPGCEKLANEICAGISQPPLARG